MSTKDTATRICPKCGRYTQVGYKVYECLCCGHVTDLRKKKEDKR